MSSIRETVHWIIRVNDGENFRNSVFPFWGMKRGHNGSIKTIISKINHGDILWFITSKKYGGKIIGMSEFVDFYDVKDEPLLQIHTKTNSEQNWKGNDLWDIQINYTNLYITEKQNIHGCIIGAATIFKYESVKQYIQGDLYEHYKNFIFYAEPKLFTTIH